MSILSRKVGEAQRKTGGKAAQMKFSNRIFMPPPNHAHRGSKHIAAVASPIFYLPMHSYVPDIPQACQRFPSPRRFSPWRWRLKSATVGGRKSLHPGPLLSTFCACVFTDIFVCPPTEAFIGCLMYGIGVVGYILCLWRALPFSPSFAFLVPKTRLRLAKPVSFTVSFDDVYPVGETVEKRSSQTLHPSLKATPRQIVPAI